MFSQSSILHGNILLKKAEVLTELQLSLSIISLLMLTDLKSLSSSD